MQNYWNFMKQQDQEPKQTEPKPSLQNQSGKQPILQPVKIQKRTYGQPSELLLPKRWPPSNRDRTKNNMNKHKVKRNRNPDTKKQAIENHNETTAPERPVMNYWGLKLVLRAQPHPQLLKWHETHNEPPR